MVISDAYIADHAKQTHSGGVELTEELRRKNLQLHERVQDSLPVFDRYRITDCDILYRILIASDANVNAATTMFGKYIKDRQRGEIDTILAKRFPAELEASAMLLYGYTREGLPILWSRPDPSLLLPLLKRNDDIESMLLVQMRGIESARFLAKESGVDRCAIVIDLQKITMSSVRSGTLNFVRELFRRQQELYPEVFRHLFVFEAGWAVEGAWKLLSPFVKRSIHRKIHFQRGPLSTGALSEWVAGDQVHPLYGGTGTKDVVAETLAAEHRRIAREMADATCKPTLFTSGGSDSQLPAKAHRSECIFNDAADNMCEVRQGQSL